MNFYWWNKAYLSFASWG